MCIIDTASAFLRLSARIPRVAESRQRARRHAGFTQARLAAPGNEHDAICLFFRIAAPVGARCWSAFFITSFNVCAPCDTRRLDAEQVLKDIAGAMLPAITRSQANARRAEPFS